MIRTIASVIRGEGLPSAFRRANERIGESMHAATARARGAFVKSEEAAILNVTATGLAPRLGGVPAQLVARLRAEESYRKVALLHSGGLTLSAPVRHTRAMPRDFDAALREALRITGARTIQLEGTDSVPLEAVLRVVKSGVDLIVSVHDFSLFCARPHLLELPAGNFCRYSHDLDRCHRCLRHTWEVTANAQAHRRALGSRVLAAATTLIFPSQFLLDQHRRLFSLPDLAGEIIEPGVAPVAIDVAAARPAIAFAGSAKKHKGAHLVPELARGAGAWHAFGGGDEDLLRAMRAAGVAVHGYYRHGQLPRLLARHRVGLVVLPSIVPETFSLVLSEAWQAGAAIVAFDLGAIAERIRRHGGGWVVPLERGAAGIAEVVDAWRSGRITTTIPTAIPSPADAARAAIATYVIPSVSEGSGGAGGA